MILEDQTRINATSAQIFDFFEQMEANYTRWHPDHQALAWRSGRGLKTGHTFYFEEYINGHLQKKTVVFTRIVPNAHIEFAPMNRFIRFLMPRLVFRITEAADHCVFTAQIFLRVGPLAARLNRKEFDAVRQHMREEGENLKALLESAPQ